MKSYSSAGQALLLLVLVPAYGALASRVNRIQLVQWVTLFFVVQSRAVPARARRRLAHRHCRTFLWVGIFNVMVIAQFWAFATDLYTPEQGKRLFPLIGVGSSLGAWLGFGSRRPAGDPRGPSRLLIGGGGRWSSARCSRRVLNRVSAPQRIEGRQGRGRQAARQGRRLRR